MREQLRTCGQLPVLSSVSRLTCYNLVDGDKAQPYDFQSVQKAFEEHVQHAEGFPYVERQSDLRLRNSAGWHSIGEEARLQARPSMLN
jgi:hypothetical protein